jgi:hypothetical protein
MTHTGRTKLIPTALLFGISAALAAQTTTFNYTGAMQTYTVPTCVTSVTVDVRGASGGISGASNLGGGGGRVQAVVPVTPGAVLNIYVGQVGASPAGGWNGGGMGGLACAGGGGASDIRLGGVALSNRIIVAGGGGGAGLCSTCTNNVNGGNGGGVSGTSGYYISQGHTAAGGGGTASMGGSAGTEVSPGTPGSSGTGGAGGGSYGGGGGGGYYGGGGGATNVCCWGGGGGGGSGYATPSATGVSHTVGFQIGDGQIMITPAAPSGPPAPGTITGSAAGCQGGTAMYSISAVAGATSYTWTAPTGTTITSGQGTTTVNVTYGSTSGNITVIATNSCGNSTPATKAIVINPTPGLISQMVGDTARCQGAGSGSYSATSNGATTYVWTITGTGNTISGTSSTATVNWNSSFTGTAQICVTPSNACGSAPMFCKNVVVSTQSTASSGAAASNNPICANFPTTLEVVGGVLGVGAQWTWYSGTCGGIPVGTGSSLVVNPDTVQTYFVRAEGACNTTSCQSVTVNALQNTLSLSTDATSASVGSSDGSAWVIVTGGLPPYSYVWSDPTNQITDTAVNLGPGIYWVTVTDSVGCVDSSSAEVIEQVGMQPLISGSILKVFPNPVGIDQMLSVRLRSESGNSLSISLYDASGRLILQDSPEPGVNSMNSEYEFSISIAKEGLYLLVLNSGQELGTTRILVSR